MAYGVVYGLTGQYRIAPGRTKLAIDYVSPASGVVAGATPDTFVVQLVGLHQIDLAMNISSPNNNLLFTIELWNVTTNSLVQARESTIPGQAFPADMYFGFEWMNLSAVDEYAFYITPDPTVFYKDYAFLLQDLNFRAVIQMFGGSGVLGAGTPGRIPVWTLANTIGDSIMSQAGTTVTVDGAVSLAGANNNTFLAFSDGQNVPVSGAGTGRIRYNNNTGTFEFSENGGAWADLSGVGPGTVNRIAKFATANTVGDSSITDDGAIVSTAETVAVGTRTALDSALGGLSVANDAGVQWSSTGAYTGAKDAALRRRAVNVIGLSDGGTSDAWRMSAGGRIYGNAVAAPTASAVLADHTTTGVTVTIATTAPHNLCVGQSITLAAWTWAAGGGVVNGTWLVTAVTDTTHFTVMPTTPPTGGSNPTVVGTIAVNATLGLGAAMTASLGYAVEIGGKVVLEVNNIAAVGADGLVLANNTASTVGVPLQTSPRIRQRAQAWDTDGSNDIWDMWSELTVTSAATTVGTLAWFSSKNGGAPTTCLTLNTGGGLYVGGNLSNGGTIIGGSSVTATRNNITTTSTDGLIATNNTAATAGVPVQYSPRIRQRAQVWDTDGSNDTWDWYTEVQPASSANTVSSWYLFNSKNGGGATQCLAMSNAGNLVITGSITSSGGLITASRSNIITTSSDSFVAQNNTAATAGVPVQYSPRLRFRGHAWDTDDLVDDTWDYWWEVVPASAASTTSWLQCMVSKNSAAATQVMQITYAGTVTVPTLIASSLSGIATTNAAIVATKSGIATTSTDGFATVNNTAATVGIPVQYSPRIRMRGQAWDTDDLVSDTWDWWTEVIPASSTTTSSVWSLSSYKNSTTLTQVCSFNSNGNVTFPSGSITTNGYVLTSRNNITTTSTDGLIAQNGTAATVGVPVQYSPRLRFRGTAWDTDGSNDTWDFWMEVQPTSAATTTAGLKIYSSKNGAAAALCSTLTDSGNLTIAGTMQAPNVLVTSALTNSGCALTPGTMTVGAAAKVCTVWTRFNWSNAMVTALGAVTTGDITICTLPAKTRVLQAYIVIATAATNMGAATLTMQVGTDATFSNFLVAASLLAAANTVYGDAAGEIGGSLNVVYGFLPSWTGTTDVKARVITDGAGGKTLADVLTCTGYVYLLTETLP